MRKLIVYIFIGLFTFVFQINSMTYLADDTKVMSSNDGLTFEELTNDTIGYVVKDSTGNIVTEKNQFNKNEMYTLSTVETSLETKTSVSLIHKFYVYHGYWDHVGTTKGTGRYYKYYTSTNQPYYSWSSDVDEARVTYSENYFKIKNVKYTRKNTTEYKKHSILYEGMDWYTNLSGWNYDKVAYEAPANK